MKFKKLALYFFAGVGAVFVLLVIIGMLAEPETKEQAKPNPTAEEKLQPYNYHREIQLKGNQAWYQELYNQSNTVHQIDFNIKSNSGIYVYFVKSKEDYEKYIKSVDRSREKFQYYEGCSTKNTQKFEGACNITVGGLMIGNTQSDNVDITIDLDIY